MVGCPGIPLSPFAQLPPPLPLSALKLCWLFHTPFYLCFSLRIWHFIPTSRAWVQPVSVDDAFLWEHWERWVLFDVQVTLDMAIGLPVPSPYTLLDRVWTSVEKLLGVIKIKRIWHAYLALRVLMWCTRKIFGSCTALPWALLHHPRAHIKTLNTRKESVILFTHINNIIYCTHIHVCMCVCALCDLKYASVSYWL